MVDSLWVSLNDWDGLSPDWPSSGWPTTSRLFFEDRSPAGAANNVLWTIFKLLVPTVLGLLLAVALNRAVRGRTLLRSIFYAPACCRSSRSG